MRISSRRNEMLNSTVHAFRNNFVLIVKYLDYVRHDDFGFFFSSEQKVDLGYAGYTSYGTKRTKSGYVKQVYLNNNYSTLAYQENSKRHSLNMLT